jgi:hypothetical protein
VQEPGLRPESGQGLAPVRSTSRWRGPTSKPTTSRETALTSDSATSAGRLRALLRCQASKSLRRWPRRSGASITGSRSARCSDSPDGHHRACTWPPCAARPAPDRGPQRRTGRGRASPALFASNAIYPIAVMPGRAAVAGSHQPAHLPGRCAAHAHAGRAAWRTTRTCCSR